MEASSLKLRDSAMIFRRRVKTPIVIQMEAVECGAAALGSVLGYYGCHLSLEELRVQCGVSRNGVSAYHIVEAAKRYGMEAAGYRATAEELRKIARPAILFWDNSHFVVLEGFGWEDVYINDPALGRRSISYAEFNRSYSGVVLEIKPSPQFKKRGRRPSIVRSIGARLWPFVDALVYMFFVQIALLVVALTIPVFFRVFIDRVLDQHILSWQWQFLGLFAVVALLTGLLTWMRDTFLNVLRTRLAIHFSAEFLWHILKLPIAFFTQRSGGEVIYRMTLNTNVANVLTSQVVVTTMNILLIGIYAAIMLQYDVVITLIGIGTAVLNLALLWIIGHLRANTYARFQQEQAKTIAVSLDTLSNMEAVKCSGGSEFFFSRIIGRYTRNINAQQEIGRRDAWLTTLSSVSQQLTTLLLLGVGVWRVMEGNLTVGMLIGLQILLSGFLRPITQLVDFGSKVQSFQVDLNRLNDVLQNAPDPLALDRESAAAEPLRGELEYQQVTFGYSPSDDPVIEDFDLRIAKGQWVALVGGVGSGKSTLARLACNLYKPSRGQILYDGLEATAFSRGQMAHLLASVDQDIILFSGTVRDNLTLWDHSIPLEQMEAAGKDACIHDEIVSRPGGYDSFVIEGGRNFSEGQRQRLEIARALILQPKILVLDEATSALDAETEATVMSNIRKRGCTCLLVAHRLTTAALCHEIVVLDNGRVVQRGTHVGLKAVPGAYQKLWSLEGTSLA